MLRTVVVLLASAAPALALPPSVNLKERNTSFKDQGLRGTCFSFATVAAIEAAYVRSCGRRYDLSEEFTVYVNRMFCRLNGAYAGARRTQTMLGDIDRGHSRHLLAHFKSGFVLPGERVMPYRLKGYTHPHRPAGYWSEQFNVSSFNLDPRNLPVAALIAKTFYGVEDFDTVPDDQLHTEDAYLTLLSRDTEVIVDFYVAGDRSGPVWTYTDPPTQKDDKHSMLLIGYDTKKKIFLAKNSQDRRKVTVIGFDYLKYVYSAAYVKKVIKPRPWPELAFIGRWQFQAGKMSGVLDVYHMNGLSRLANAVVSGVPGPCHDYRLGMFYQDGDPKKAYRVNGKVTQTTVRLWFDPENPNMRPDERQGPADFVLTRGDDVNVLSGPKAAARRLTEPEAFAGSEQPLKVGPGSRSPFTLNELAR